MFEKIMGLFKKKEDKKESEKVEEEKKEIVNKEKAKERLHLVLVQDRVNVSADFLDMMKQEIIEVIKKYVDIDESEIDVKLTSQKNSDGTVGIPALYANIPITGVKEETRKFNKDLEKLKEEAELESENTEVLENTEKSEEETQTAEEQKAEENSNKDDN